MARTEFKKSVQREAIERAAGFCQGLLPSGERCPCELRPGRYQVDHILPDWLGGKPTLANAQVLCTDCHKAKTARDVARICKAKRQSDAHQGVKDPHARRLQSAPFRPGQPARRASSKLTKDIPPRRSPFTREQIQ